MNRSSTYNEFLQDIQNESFGQKVNKILGEQRRSQIWLAEQIGISKQALSYILNHSQKPKYISEIAHILGVSPQWLKGEAINETKGVLLANMGRRIPIHSMKNFPLAKIPNAAVSTECVIIDATLSLDCFAVLLDNSSMEPLFKKKSVLIFDPNKVAENESFVLAKRYNSQDVFFRQIIMDGRDVYLKAIDTLYKPMRNESHDILGVLIESRIIF